jgi:hypothetical protein
MYLLSKDDDQARVEKLSEKEKKSYKRKTITIRNSPNPKFDQMFRVLFLKKKICYFILYNMLPFFKVYSSL